MGGRDEKKDDIGCRSKYGASEDRRDKLCVTREAVLDEYSKIHGDQRDGLRKLREVREDGFDQKPKRKTCKRQVKTDEMTSASRSDKFDSLHLTERGLEVEMVNAVDAV